MKKLSISAWFHVKLLQSHKSRSNGNSWQRNDMTRDYVKYWKLPLEYEFSVNVNWLTHHWWMLNVYSSPLCENFMIFLSLRFYVKSILTISWLWFWYFMNFCTFEGRESYQINKNQYPKNVKNSSFRTSTFSKVDFT